MSVDTAFTSFYQSLTDFSQTLQDTVFSGFVLHSDTPAQAAVRARGINPDTGQPITPGYAASLRLMGVDTSDPNSLAKFVSDTASQADAQFTSDFNSNFQQLGGVSFLPFSPVIGGDAQALKNASSSDFLVLIVVALVVIFIIFQAVS